MEKNTNKLDQIGNKNPFSVPENYFEDFARNMQKQISEKENTSLAENEKKPTKIVFMQKMKPFLYAAATLALVFVVGDYLTMKTQMPTQDTWHLAETTIPFIDGDEDEQMEILLSFIDEGILTDFLFDN